MTAEKQLEKIAKMLGFDHVWEDRRPGTEGVWFAERTRDDHIEAVPIEAIIRNATQ